MVRRFRNTSDRTRVVDTIHRVSRRYGTVPGTRVRRLSRLLIARSGTADLDKFACDSAQLFSRAPFGIHGVANVANVASVADVCMGGRRAGIVLATATARSEQRSQQTDCPYHLSEPLHRILLDAALVGDCPRWHTSDELKRIVNSRKTRRERHGFDGAEGSIGTS